MTIPLMVLAIPASLAGFGFSPRASCLCRMKQERGWLVPGVAFAAMLVGVRHARSLLIASARTDPIDIALFRKRFYFDEIYAFLIGRRRDCSRGFRAFLDRWILDAGDVRGVSGATWGFGSLLRLLQVGNLQAYAFLFGLGIVGLIYFTLFR